jgi:hypothetical protein
VTTKVKTTHWTEEHFRPRRLFPVIVRSNGQATSHRHFVRAIPASVLDEDSSDIAPSDEIEARVTLTPFGPVPASGVSNIVQIVV